MHLKKIYPPTLVCFLLVLGGNMSHLSAQLSITGTGTPFTLNFNTYTGAGFQPNPTAGQLSSNTWSLGVMSDAPGTLAFGGTATSGDFARGQVSTAQSSGGAYARTITPGNNAMWFQPAGSDFLLNSFVTLRAQNNTGSAMTALDVAYDLVYMNDQARSTQFNFSWSTDNTNWNPVPSLDFTSGCASTGTSVLAAARSISLTGLNVANGDFIYLRWTPSDDATLGCNTGSRDEIGLDNISLTIPNVVTSSFNFSAATATVNESAGTLTGTVTLSQSSNCTVEVTLSGVSTATNGQDFAFSTPTVISSTLGGPTTFQFSATLTDDLLPELVETMVFSLSNATGGCLIGATNTFTATIQSSDLPSISNIVITELMYNPAELGTDSTEFIELYNNNASSVNLIGTTFSLGVNYTFPVSTLIAPGEYVVLCNNLAAFNNRYPGVTAQKFQWTQGALDNVGETVRLTNAFGQTIDSVTFDDQAPWPTAAAGNGASIVLCSPTVNNASVSNWFVATATNWGTVNAFNVLANPGSADAGVSCPLPTFGFGTATATVAESAGSTNYTLTLSNPSDCTVDVVLQPSTATVNQDFTFSSPQTVTFTAGGSSFQTFSLNIIDDLLPEGTEQVVLALTNPQGGCALAGTPTFTATIPSNDFQAVSNLVITEIMYNSPESGTDTLEFIEFQNANATPLRLLGCSISDAIVFHFPDTTLAPSAYFVACVSSRAFQNVYGGTAVQWTSGGLTNGGEIITVRDGLNNIVDQVTYDDVAPWPTQGNGLGRSIVLCSPNNNNAVASNWFAATTATGDVINGQAMFANPGVADPGVYCFQTPEIALVGTFVDVEETAGTATLTLQYNGYSNAATNVDLQVDAASTATAGLDYTFTSPLTVTFPAFTVPGSTQTVTVPILADALTEGNETIVFNLSNATNGATLGNATFTVTILCSLGSNVILVNDNAIGANDGSTWNNAFTSLQSALAIAVPGDEIWVAQGTYYPTTGLNRNAAFVLRPSVSLYGSFPDNGGCSLNDRLPYFASTLSGDIGIQGDNSDNSLRVVMAENVGSNVTVDQFIIQFGNASPGLNGSGVYLRAKGAGQVCSPVFNNCSICFNNAPLLGGGIYIEADYGGVANPSFTAGEIVFNTATNGGAGATALAQRGGVAILNLGNNILVGNNSTPRRGGGVTLWTNAGGTTQLNATGINFSGNTGTLSGGALYTYARQGSNATVMLSNVGLYGNASANGGGIYLHGQGATVNANFANIDASSNTATAAGAGIMAYSEAVGGNVILQINGAQVANNNAVSGGALALYSVNSGNLIGQLTNCRLIGNSASQRGGAIAFSNVRGTLNATLSNALVTGNSSAYGGGFHATATTPAAQNLQWGHLSMNGNTASLAGNHAYLIGAATAQATNGIFWNGPAASNAIPFMLKNTSALTFNHCLLDVLNQAAIPNGTGIATCNNVLYNLDPFFANAPSNLMPLSGSPAIDAGIPAGVIQDLNGAARPQGSGYDLGAYEFMAIAPRLAENTETALEWSVLPNPTYGPLVLSFGGETTGLVQIFDLQGRLVASQTLNGASSATFDLGELANGTYLARVVCDGEVLTAQIVLQKP